MREQKTIEEKFEDLRQEFKTLRHNIEVTFGRISRDFQIHRDKMQETEEKE
jgi:hypothetical protein